MSIMYRWEQAKEEARYPDSLRRFIYQAQEEDKVNTLPHVIKQLPRKATVMGFDSPHQMGDHVSYDMYTRCPMALMTSHFTEIAPNAPVRGAHRHIGAPALFYYEGKGWEFNDGVIYDVKAGELLVVPPYTIHQHGGEKDIGAKVYVPEVGRIGHLMGLMWREQHKLSEKPVFPEGTEPLHNDKGQLIGYRIKKGILGVKKDIDVVIGPEPKREEAFLARRKVGPWQGEVKNTYDRYLKLMHDETHEWRVSPHVIHGNDVPWEMTRQGKLKWMVHPTTRCTTKGQWIYWQEIPPGSRSGKHRHAGEELIWVAEGKGHDIHDGTRWDWVKDDLLCIPVMTTHQHFNADPKKPALLFSAISGTYMDLGLGGIEQIEDAPEYRK